MITLVNVFDVHAPAADFTTAFRAVSEVMRTRPGFRSHRLLCSQHSPSRYVNVAEWDDETSLRTALADPAVAGVVRSLMRLSSAAPQTYRTVLDVPTQEI